MIWVGGEIVPDSSLRISAMDRTFEHGLGLFETFRTWNGHPTLLDRHLARMRRSAEELQIALDQSALPDALAVADLRRAEGCEGDAAYRITMSGGTPGGEGPLVWMRSRPLPPPHRPEGAALLPMTGMCGRHDPMTRYKSLNYLTRRWAFERAMALGADEAILVSDGIAREGSRTNLFAVVREELVTPGLDGPILPGIMRQVVLERAERLGIPTRQNDLSMDSLMTASEVFLTNSVRGILPVARVEGRSFDAPGPWTRTLQSDVLSWLNRGGADS